MLALALAAGAVFTVPARADTASELEAAKSQVEETGAELDRLNRLWQDAEAQLARAEDAAADARSRITELEAALVDIQVRLNDRVAAVYMLGGNLTLGALLTSDSAADAADRIQFVTNVVQGDEDLATSVAVQTEELRRERDRLADAVDQQASAVASLQAQRDAIELKFAEFESQVADLQQQLEEEAAAPAAERGDLPATDGDPPVIGTGWIQTCPVAGATSFVDSFGDPRPGGRTHQGIDMIAAAGTPVVAVHPGNAVTSSSDVGGLGMIVYHEGSSDWTFYTHFGSYGATGQVSAGTVIGYVGSTGSTSVNHLHFEYHPGGGAAVDPYQALLGAC